MKKQPTPRSVPKSNGAPPAAPMEVLPLTLDDMRVIIGDQQMTIHRLQAHIARLTANGRAP